MVLCIYLFYVERRVAVHHQVDVHVLCSKPLDANVLKSAIGDGFTHRFEVRAGESLLHEVVVRILALLDAGVYELLHGCTDDFVGDLVVLADQFLYGLQPVSACICGVFMLGHQECRWLLC